MSDIRYFIKRPSPKRKSFALVGYKLAGRQKTYCNPEPRVSIEAESINAQYLNGTITAGQAELLLQEIIRREAPRSRAANRAQLISINRELFDRFWKDVYGVRYLEDPRTMHYDFLKALRLLEPVSLQTASQSEIQSRLRERCAGAAELRRATDRLNQVIKYLKRDFRLNKPKPEMKEIRHVTWEELKAKLSELPAPLDTLAVVLFSTGARLGEALALEIGDYRKGEVIINKQITAQGKKKLPKREKTGRSLVLPIGEAELLRWLKVKNKIQYRDKIYDALVRVYGISPHDLRHSHAIHLLRQGASLTQVALQLRNRIEVCQAYYTGFAHTEGTLDALRLTLRQSR